MEDSRIKGGFRRNRHETDSGPVAKGNSVGRELLFHQPCPGVAWLLPTKGLMAFSMELALDRHWDSWGSPVSCIPVTESGLSTKLFCKQMFKLWALLLSRESHYNTLKMSPIQHWEQKLRFICLNQQLHNSLSATQWAKCASSKQSWTFLGDWGMPQIQNRTYITNWIFWGGLGSGYFSSLSKEF